MISNITTMKRPDVEIRMGKYNTEQPDGASWSVYYDKNNPRRYLILTSVGREKLLSGRGIRQGLHAYRMAETGEDQGPGVRQKLGQGREAAVFKLGNYAVREKAKVRDDLKAVGMLGLMDTLSSVIEAGVPRWLDVPKHYALYSDPTTGKTYTIMDRIDGGVTVEDLMLYPDLSEPKIKAVESEMAGSLREAQSRVPDLYDQAYSILAEALEARKLQPGTYLNDWQPRNVVVDRIATPIAGSNFTLDVIDQYGTTLLG